MEVDVHKRQAHVGGRTFNEGDWFSLNGTRGHVYEGRIATIPARPLENADFIKFMKLADKFRAMKVRTNADTPEDAAKAREFGAEGIGLFRTEHMFYGKGSEQPLFLLRKMIVSGSLAERRAALAELYPFVKKDIKATLAVMDGLPVTIRLLDPPLHEFVPTRPDEREKLAQALGITASELDKRADDLHESNPMMGHRGVRLGVTFPEISEMQFRAIFESALELRREGKKVFPEIMVPVVGLVAELDDQLALAKRVHAEVCAKYGVAKIDHMYGTMIEIPRACLTADKIAGTAEFFSFGTNDLTQMTFGFSRDDIGGFVPEYLEKRLLAADPFQILDREGVGQLVEMGIKRGRSVRPKLKVGICGEHGGEPSSVEFCHIAGMDYVSCSPFRVPIARLAAAQAELTHPRGKMPGSGVRGSGSAKAKAGKSAAKGAAKAAAKPKAKAATKPKAKAATKPKAKVAAKPKAKVAVKTTAKAKAVARPKSKRAARPKAKPAAKPTAKATTKPKAKGRGKARR